MKHLLDSALRCALRVALAGLCATAPVVLVASSACYYPDDDDGFCDDDDFDDDDFNDDEDCGDDDDGSVIIIVGQTSESYRLERYRIEPSSDPDAHPVACVLDVEDLSIFALLGPGAYGAQDFRDVSDRILLSNEDLLGLPARAGRRRFHGVVFSSQGIAVSYAQESEAEGSFRDVPGAATVLHYDLGGALAFIENRVFLDARPTHSPHSPLSIGR